MAAKNSVKEYSTNSFYHLYNRGVNKTEIFLDEQDFSVFCSYLKDYLLPKDEIGLRSIISSDKAGYKEKAKALKLLAIKNFSAELSLLSYALLPNHFHFLVYQTEPNSIDRFMNSFGVRYSSYFNRKYKRVGPLVQGRYKAVRVHTDDQLLHLSRYIHLNPFVKLGLKTINWRDIPWPFSLPEYLGERDTPWLKPEQILSYFRKESPNDSYQSFVGANLGNDSIGKLILETDD